MPRTRKTEIVPIPRPEPNEYDDRPWFRSRRICFSMEDWQAFDAAMHIACPYVRYYRWITNKEEQSETPPPIRLSRDICEQRDPQGRMARFVRMFFRAGL